MRNANHTELFPESIAVKELAGGYYLVITIDEEGARCASIMTSTDEMGVCFAWESQEEENVVVNDHGMIPGQYLTDSQIVSLYNIGLLPGKEFEDFDQFIEYCNF